MRVRDDILTVSIGPENVAVLKAEAAREGLPVSALVRSWASSLAHEEADDE
jgi:hypothetical protein